jgi:hypothetical protein
MIPTKKCCTCKVFLPLDSFGLYKTHKDGRHHKCKECRKKEPSRKEYLKEWNENNKEKKSKLSKVYREVNKEKLKLYKKSERYKKIKAKSDKKYSEKVKQNPARLMSCRLRSMISTNIKNKKFKTFDLLGYTSLELVKHLESKFLPEMNWGNYGRNGWHIDHIKPLVLFDLDNTEEVKKAFALDNLQPLWESENCSKGSLYEGIRHKTEKAALHV